MAGDWIKMRGGLMQHPKLIAMGRHLMKGQLFREWLTPGGGGPFNGQIVSDDALRCVTCALLLRVWSVSREYGKFDGDDLVLAHLTIPDIDLMAGCPGVGEAMFTVGWAKLKNGECEEVVLPNFKQHNAPMSSAEKQSAYRNRKSVTNKSTETESPNVTTPLPNDGNKTVTREEKSIYNTSETKSRRKSKAPRDQDPLFDAIANVTHSDLKASASFIGTVRAALGSAEPPYTPAEVLLFADRFRELCPWAKDRDHPELGELQKHIGKVRANGYHPTPPPRTKAVLDAPRAEPLFTPKESTSGRSSDRT